MKKFSDFADEHPLIGEKIKLKDILNIVITVLEYKISNSKHNSGEYARLQVQVNGEDRLLFTGSNILISQIKKYEEHLPFETTIRQIDKYYTFT